MFPGCYLYRGIRDTRGTPHINSDSSCNFVAEGRDMGKGKVQGKVQDKT